MKSLAITIMAAALLVGCGEPQQTTKVEPAEPDEPAKLISEEPEPAPSSADEVPEPVVVAPEPVEEVDPTMEDLNLALRDAASAGDLEGIRQQLEAGADVNAKDANGKTIYEVGVRDEATASFLRKHGAKTSRELDLEEK